MRCVILLIFPLVTFLPLIAGLYHRCPKKETIAPFCTCKINDRSNDVTITCKGIQRTFELQETLKPLQNYIVDKLIIEKSGVFEVTAGTFSKLTIHAITFREVEFRMLPMLTFLDGVHNSIEEVELSSCNVSEWIWHKGTHFAFLRSMVFHNTALPKLMENDTFAVFPNNIRRLKMSSTRIKQLSANALRKFGNLERLELPNNEIAKYERSTFPLPAVRLSYLSLINNPLKSLPEDAFVQMRRLEILILSATHLTTLDQNTFKPVWEQLEEVYFNNIYLDCDCSSTWLLEKPNKREYREPFCRSKNGKVTLISRVKHDEICPDS